MGKNLADLKCQSTVYLTPPTALQPVRDYFGGPIPLDPATEPTNPTEALAFGCDPSGPSSPPGTPGICLGDGLQIPWHQHAGTFLNPPYSKQIRPFLEKLHEEVIKGATVIALLPAGARYATKYWQRDAFNERLNAICFVRGRVKFLRPDGTPTTGSNPYDSQFMLYNGDTDRFIECFRASGKVLALSGVY